MARLILVDPDEFEARTARGRIESLGELP
jgi:hypothetical protein